MEKVTVIRCRIPSRVICPTCHKRQPFKKKRGHFKTVKDMSLDRTRLLKIEVVYARCLNKQCPVKSFRLPTPGISLRYQRATDRLIKETVSSVVEDNSTCPRISRRLNRSYNTTGSIATVDRWKHRIADRYNVKELIQRLEFSGLLCIDEYKPSRHKGYDLIDSDGKTSRILYIEPAEGLGRGVVKRHFEKLKEFGIRPWGVIFDMRACFAGSAKKAFGEKVLIQHDYFHVMKIVHYHLNRAMAEYRRQMREDGSYIQDLWEAKWIILKNIEYWTARDHKIMELLLKRYSGTLIEDILILKQRIRDIFLDSQNSEEAYASRDALLEEGWHLKNSHFNNIMTFLSKPYFRYMVTFLDHPELPKSGNSENVIRVWRQMEKVRYGFKTHKGKLDHLKLHQIKRYLGEEFR
jgi:hypothetical protein